MNSSTLWKHDVVPSIDKGRQFIPMSRVIDTESVSVTNDVRVIYWLEKHNYEVTQWFESIYWQKLANVRRVYTEVWNDMCISLYVCIRKQCMKCWFQHIMMALLWAARSRYGTSITCSLWFPWTRGWPTVLNCTGVGMSACKVISKPRRTLIHGEGIHQLHSWWGGTGSMMDRGDSVLDQGHSAHSGIATNS